MIIYPWEIPGWVLCPSLIFQLTFLLSLCLGPWYTSVYGRFMLFQFAWGVSCPHPAAVPVADGAMQPSCPGAMTTLLLSFEECPRGKFLPKPCCPLTALSAFRKAAMRQVKTSHSWSHPCTHMIPLQGSSARPPGSLCTAAELPSHSSHHKL